jgi:hypothetical protein
MASLLMLSFADALNYGGIGGRPAYSSPTNPRTQSIFIFNLSPGQSASNAVDVQNDTNQTQTINIDSVDSELATGGQFTCKQAVEPKTDVGSWIALQQTSVTVPPNSDKVVPFTITVPNSNKINVGEHDGCITLEASSQTAAPSNKNGILLSFRTAIRVVVTIPGQLIKKMVMNTVKVTNGNKGYFIVTPSFSNEGNVSLDTKLSLQLVSLFGTSSGLVNEGTMPVLPNSSMNPGYEISHPFWGGFYMAKAIASYNDNPETGLGVQTNANQKVLVKNSSIFFATPKPLAALTEILILLVLVALVVWLVRGRSVKSQIKDTWTEYDVKHGDTLVKLAERSGVSWKRIAIANKIRAPYTLNDHQKIKLPPIHKD